MNSYLSQEYLYKNEWNKALLEFELGSLSYYPLYHPNICKNKKNLKKLRLVNRISFEVLYQQFF